MNYEIEYKEDYINMLFKALANFAKSPEAVDNFKSYVEHHYNTWIGSFAATGTGLIDEMYHFSQIQ